LLGVVIIATKSLSTSPDGRLSVSTIIFVIALTFSARYSVSSGEAERNAVAHSAAMYSTSDFGSSEHAGSASLAVSSVVRTQPIRELHVMLLPTFELLPHPPDHQTSSSD
jgi:hypothetical protein